ncbi:methylated-DNA-protein-cysteine S-methyltransferase [Candidatus Magnetoovum chiemensis]|nr:methylated-DNA-protein-cysteine S-methyltransferase [Candidatus Magnetoovum chiemensis]
MTEPLNNYCTIYESPVGILYISAQDDAIYRISFDKPDLRQTKTNTPALRQLDEYFLKKRSAFDIKIAFKNITPFQRQVYESVLKIAYGDKKTYKWIANYINKPKSARAVGQALKRNPLLILVPCHRVIGEKGKLCGYNPDIKIKRWLLDHESIT